MSEEATKHDADRRQRTAERAAEALYRGDAASQQLGMTIESCGPGRATVSMRIRPDMVNGHRICHGWPRSLRSPTALSPSPAIPTATTPSRPAPRSSSWPRAREGDVLRAIASERWRAGRAGIYEIEVRNQRDETVALFRGRSHQIAGRLIDD